MKTYPLWRFVRPVLMLRLGLSATAIAVVVGLTSQRPYKKPLAFEETVQILEQDRGKHFDPAVLDAFERIARPPYNRYCGHEGADLKDELDTAVARYFRAGMETLYYGEET